VELYLPSRGESESGGRLSGNLAKKFFQRFFLLGRRLSRWGFCFLKKFLSETRAGGGR
jgi:hypothetical protein